MDEQATTSGTSGRQSCDQPALEQALAANRSRMLGLAYRMLGTLGDAEDVLQDAWLRLSRQDLTRVASLDGLLVATVTHLCLDVLKSARHRREHYVGPWLPEPVADAAALAPGPDSAADPAHSAERADDLSFGLMLALQALSAPERAAFLLHDVFEVPFAEVAGMLDRQPADCRQLATRARKALRGQRMRRAADPGEHQALLHAFVAAAASGDPENIAELLASDVVLHADGGGLRTAATRPLHGPRAVSRFFAGIVRQASAQPFALSDTTLNGWPALLVEIDGVVDLALGLAVDDQRIRALYIQRNPEKLTRLGASGARA